jgi:hypothetical protein
MTYLYYKLLTKTNIVLDEMIGGLLCMVFMMIDMDILLNLIWYIIKLIHE